MMNGRSAPNNFDALRICAATAVLYSHQHALTGQFEPSVLGLHTLGGFAVLVFFTISGYLVTTSWRADPSVLRFAARRALRIWPAYTAVVFLSVYGLGAWLSELPLGAYLRDPDTAGYLANIALASRNALPGVFMDNPLPRAVNGSLWTIPLEVQCYVALAAAGLLGALRHRAIWLGLIGVMAVWYQARFGPDFHADWQLRREMLLYFVAGSAASVLQAQWDTRRIGVTLVLSALAAALWLAQLRYLALLSIVPFAVIAFGTSSTPVVRRVGRWGDPSYGIYLIAFPVQQAVIQLFWPALGFGGTLALALAITVALAYLSWHGLEKFALRLKPRRQPNAAWGRALKDRATTAVAALKRGAPLLGWLWLCWILVAALNKLLRHLPDPAAPLNSDATWTYLPNARKLLQQPWAFLSTDPASYHVAPGGYLWAAAWGADPISIQWANALLFLGCVGLMWRSARRLGGLLAGVVATALLVYLPHMMVYVPQVLTETPYLFGLLLGTTAAIEYALGHPRPRLMLALAAMGLAITLLVRPVLQLFTLGALALALTWVAYRRLRRTRPAAGTRDLVNTRVCLALCAALVLPAAVIVKNGAYFGVWSLGTGAGTGLYYGVSPFKMGLEPVYTGFKYDAGLTPLTADPRTRGHPLSQRADAINGQVALSLVRNTSAADNVAFFAGKLRAWLLYSTPELSMYPKLRSFRLFEWLTIALAALSLAWRWRGAARMEAAALPGAPGPAGNKLALLSGLLALTLAMAVQLTPVLYNTRYNQFFLEPWLMLLCGVGAAVLLQWRATPRGAWRALLLQAARMALIVALLAWLPPALSRYAARHETLAMDQYRPGPVAVLLNAGNMGPVRARNAQRLDAHRWQLDVAPATLQIPVHVPSPASISPDQVLDAIWRLRLAIQTPPAARACSQATLGYTDAHPLREWYQPASTLRLHDDGELHTYAFHGNDILRPAGDGLLTLTFACAPGTIVRWDGAELLRSTLPEAARALIQHGTPIDPYWRREPR